MGAWECISERCAHARSQTASEVQRERAETLAELLLRGERQGKVPAFKRVFPLRLPRASPRAYSSLAAHRCEVTCAGETPLPAPRVFTLRPRARSHGWRRRRRRCHPNSTAGEVLRELAISPHECLVVCAQLGAEGGIHRIATILQRPPL